MISLSKSTKARQYLVVFIMNLTILTTGMSLAWPSPVLVKLRSIETPLHRRITDEEGSWIVSIGSLCITFGLSFLGMLQDCIGRKYCLILTCIPKVLVSILFVFAKDVRMLIFGRAIIGSADFYLLTVVPVYASEIADKDIRGSLGTFLQIFSSLGVVLTMSVGPFVSYTTYSIVFAAMNLFMSIPVLFLPDSPFFLYSKGKKDKAIDVLKFLRGSEELAKEEISMYDKSLNNQKIEIKSLLKDRVFLKTLGISIIFGATTQVTGFNAISFYLQTILESTKTSLMPEIASIIISLIQLLASCSSAFVIDRFQRKRMLITSFIGLLLGLIGMGAFFKIRENTQEVTGFMNYLPLISLILVVYCYSAGIGSLFWVVIAELFDGPARAIGVTICIIVTSFGIFLTTKYFATLTTAVGPSMTYWFFGIACAFSALFIYYCVPETKGKSFKEIQMALGAKVGL